jgi:UDP-N-acetyl-D-mannosaminuronic acid dehydrogenase
MGTQLHPGNKKTAGRPDICVVGGAGHVGLPLAIVLASKGLHVLIHDINVKALELIAKGVMPFMEQGADSLLNEVLAKGSLEVTSNFSWLAGVPDIIVTIGTPIDEFLNPSPKAMTQCFEAMLPYLSEGQVIILRSTVSPGTTEWLERYLRVKGKAVPVAFCPERIVQGYAIRELQTLPQIISGTSPEAVRRSEAVFSLIAPELVRLEPMEAEFAKLFCNAYRYVQFAISNQFFMIANSAGQDYYRVLEGMKKSYARMQDIPRAGFAAGPCLFKDTMQIAASYNNEFSLGSAAMLINEGLPLYMVEQIARAHDLQDLTVGLLGMAFKADSDDPRASLSYKLKKVLLFRAKAVLTSDPYVKGDPDLIPADEVVERSDILILCTPHAEYKNLQTRGKRVFDIWNCFGFGARM